MYYKYNIDSLALHKNYWGLERLGIILTPLKQIQFFEEYSLLPQGSIISIDIDENTYIDTGYLYITMTDCFLVVDMKKKTVVDMYSFTEKGKSGATLDKEEILDSDILVTN